MTEEKKIPCYTSDFYSKGFKLVICCDVWKFFNKECNHTYQDLETSQKIFILYADGRGIYDIIPHPEWLEKIMDKQFKEQVEREKSIGRRNGEI